MEIQRQNGTLAVNGVGELSAVTARFFRNEICAMLVPELERIEIDLSETSFVDSSGLGALVTVFKAANEQGRRGGVRMRLLNPPPPVRQVFELTRIHHLFEIVVGESESVAESAMPEHPVEAAGSR